MSVILRSQPELLSVLSCVRPLSSFITYFPRMCTLYEMLFGNGNDCDSSCLIGARSVTGETDVLTKKCRALSRWLEAQVAMGAKTSI